jgi:hypothetical protein
MKLGKTTFIIIKQSIIYNFMLTVMPAFNNFVLNLLNHE